MYTQGTNIKNPVTVMSAGPQFLFSQKKPQGLASGWVSGISGGWREVPPNLYCKDSPA